MLLTLETIFYPWRASLRALCRLSYIALLIPTLKLKPNLYMSLVCLCCGLWLLPYQVQACPDQSCPYDGVEAVQLTADQKESVQAIVDAGKKHITSTFQEWGGDKATERQGFIFVSSSMPMQTLVAYEKAAQKYGFHLIMRGLIDGSYRATHAYFEDFIKETGGGISIDPELFERYEVSQAPTIIFEQGEARDQIKGNVTLDYALQEFAKTGDTSFAVSKLLGEGKL